MWRSMSSGQFPRTPAVFHDFIVAAASPVFNQHLSNLLSSRIAEMSLPLDLQKYAEDAVKRGRLALTIPWMVEFLALMDPVAPNIDFMRSLLQQLRRILNHSWHHLKVSGFSYSGLLVVTSLGWLFDMELQENFFHLHPASLRRTVEFVSERTASNFIKYLRANSLPDSLAACVKEIGDLLTRMPSVHSSRAKEKAQQEIPLKAQNLCTGQRKKMLEAQKEFCYGRIAESLKLLLPEDHPESVIVTATAIACRIAKTKIQNWIHKNVTVVCNRPELWTNQMPSLCIRLWRGVLRGYVELSPLHSRLAHNLLAQASADQQVYELLDDFLTTLVKEGLLLDSDLEVDASY
nr:hypothetical protein BaRGS_031341 [Batillaria attramentaria]